MKTLILAVLAIAIGITVALWDTDAKKPVAETIISQEVKVPAKPAEAKVASGKRYKDSGFSFVGP